MKLKLFLFTALLLFNFTYSQTLDQRTYSEFPQNFNHSIILGQRSNDPFLQAAQSFTLKVPGELAQIKVPYVIGVSGFYGPSTRLFLYRGEGINSNNYVTNVFNDSRNIREINGFYEYSFNLPSGIQCSAGDIFTFVITRDTTTTSESSMFFVPTFNSETDTHLNYIGGKLYYSNSSSGFTEFPYIDLSFQTYVNALPAHNTLRFDGIDDYVDLPNESNFDFSNEMTVEFWMNSNVTPDQWDTLIGKGDDSWRVALTNTGKISFAATNVFSDLFSTESVTDGLWHHIAVSYNGSLANIYIDGALSASQSANGTINNSNYKVSIGENLQSTGRFYNGSIDELRIWNTARTQIEINSFKECEIPNNQTGLVSYYKFNQGYEDYDNNTVVNQLDDALNANHGTLYNFALTGTVSNFNSTSPIISNVIIPNPPIVSNETLWYNLNDTASPLTANGGNSQLIWYNSETSTTGNTNAPTPDTSVFGYQSHWVASSNGGNCESERVEIKVYVAKGDAKSLHFDGIDDHLTSDSSHTAVLTDGGALSFYLKLEANPVGQVSIIKSQNWDVKLNADGKIGIWINNLYNFTTFSNKNVIDNEWHHIIVSFKVENNSWVERIYIDGKLDVESTMSSQSPLIIPGPATINIGNFKGFIDELMVLSYLPDELINNPFCYTLNPLDILGSGFYYSFDKGIANGNERGIANGNNIVYGFGGVKNNLFIYPKQNTGFSGCTLEMHNFSYIGFESNFSDHESSITKPIAPTVTTPIKYFITEPTTILTATPSNGYNLIWYENENDFTGSLTAPTPSSNAVGSTSYWVAEKHPSGCESERAEIVVNINDATPATHLQFDGVDDYVNLGNNTVFNFTTNFTVEFWMKSTGRVDQWDTLIGKGDDSWRVALINTGEISFSGTNAFNIFSSTPVTDGEWHHVAVTYDGINAKIYLDGGLNASQPATNAINISNYDVAIGENMQQNGRFFKGFIDDVRIWNTARTATSIVNAMSCELIGNEANLISYYNFNQGLNGINNSSQNTLTDTLNTNLGTLVNFQLTGNESNWLSGFPLSVSPNIPVTQTSVLMYQGQFPVALSATSMGTGLIWYKNLVNDEGSSTAPMPDVTALGSTKYWVASTNDNGCESEKVEIIVNVIVGTQGTDLNFYDSDDKVNCGNILTPSYTKEAMIYVATPGALNSILSGSSSRGAAHTLIIPSSNGRKLSAGHNDALSFQVQDSETIELNTWYHVAVTYDAATTTMKLYKNGVLVASNSNIPPFDTRGNSNVLYINAVTTGNGLGFEGNYDEVRVWNYAREAYQIKSALSCELIGNEPGLIAYYKFNQGLANNDNNLHNQLLDSSGNVNHGNLSGFALNSVQSNWVATSPIISNVSIPEVPTVNSPIVYNINETTSVLTATTTSNGLIWYNSQNSTVGSTTAPTPDTSAIGAYSYWVSSINSNGCESERAEIVVNVNGTLNINEFDNDDFKIYPNPTNGKILINIKNKKIEFIEILDINGRLIRSLKDIIKNTLEVDLSKFETGVYFIKINTAKNQIIKRVIKY